jgi:hypothetical protein
VVDGKCAHDFSLGKLYVKKRCVEWILLVKYRAKWRAFCKRRYILGQHQRCVVISRRIV